MHPPILPTVACACGVALAGAPSAWAASAVYGGSARGGEAIVVQADRHAAKVKSLVVAWDANCDSGKILANSDVLSVGGVATSGLQMSRNRRGRFAGTQTSSASLGANGTALMVVSLRGTLRPTRASGTIAAVVKIVDQTGNQLDSCKSGTLPWWASRAAGRVYAGSTSQQEPVVVKLNRKRRKATDVLIGWHTATCTPPDQFLSFGEHFDNFPLSARGAFGGSFTQSFPMDGGGKIDFSYQLNGSIGKRQGHGTFRVNATATDGTGATALTCDSAPISWKAVTG
jgi:hypothetical protein